MRKKKGFTLVELLAVLVVLALLALIAIRSIKGIVKNSKETIDDQAEAEILQAAEKWSVENSDKFDDSEGKTIQVGLDIVFVVDVSGSMENSMVEGSYKNYNNSRYKATAEAIQGALTTLKQNEKSRIAFVYYSGRSAGRYGSGCSTSTGTATSGCSVIYKTDLLPVKNIGDVTSRDGYIVSSGTNVPIDGGTYTQLGVEQAATILLNASNKEGRIPVVIVLTDGEPTWGRKYTNDSEYRLLGSSNLGTGSGTSGALGWYLIRTSMLAKQNISGAYKADTFFYTIGLGVSTNFGQFILDPKEENLALIKNSREDAAESLYNDYISRQSNYNYATASFSGSMNADELNKYFQQITNDVTEATKVTEVCVSVKELYDSGYLSKSDVKLSDGTSASEYVLMYYNEPTNQYQFSLAKSTEQKDRCKALLD